MTQKPDKSFNSRGYRGQVERELIVGAILIMLVVSGGTYKKNPRAAQWRQGDFHSSSRHEKSTIYLISCRVAE